MDINTEMRSQCNHIDTGWHAIKLFDGSEARSSIISVRSVVTRQTGTYGVYIDEMASRWGRITGVFTDDSKNAYRSGFSWITNSFFDYTVQQKQLTDISKIVAVLSCRISIKSWQTVTKGKVAAVVRHGHKKIPLRGVVDNIVGMLGNMQLYQQVSIPHPYLRLLLRSSRCTLRTAWHMAKIWWENFYES